MSETLSFSPEPNDAISEDTKSQFGSKEMVQQAMEAGNVLVLGNIEEFYDVAPHRNVVELAQFKFEQHGTRNVSELIEIDTEGAHFLGVFKPVAGEDATFHNQNGLGHDYPREAASYLVSEHFGFDLVPPTIIRTVNGRLGSLQLFLPPDKYHVGAKAMLTIPDEKAEAVLSSPDIEALHVFDWITANADRHGDNYMCKVDGNGVADVANGAIKIAAIDNGSAFNDQFYRLKANRADIPGPYQFLTYDNLTKTNRYVLLPSLMKEKLASGYRNKEELTKALLAMPDIEPIEISKIWERVEKLLSAGVFISGHNYREFR